MVKEEEREEVFRLVIAIYKATMRLDRGGDGNNGNDDIDDNTPITKGDLKKAIVKAFIQVALNFIKTSPSGLRS